MTDIVDARTLIQAEETRFRAPNSESMFTRMGGTVNFISNRQEDSHGFFLNGPYNPGEAGTALDGLHSFLFDAEIVGVTVFNMVSGSAGTSEFDVIWLSASGVVQGSIFSTTPKITSAAPNFAYGTTNLVTATSQGGTGITLPTLSKTEFNQFDAIRLDLPSAMTAAQNAGVVINYRPR